MGHRHARGTIAAAALVPGADREFEPSGPGTPELLTAKQVAAMLNVSHRTIYRLVACGELPGPVKVGSASRFPASEVHGFVERLKDERRTSMVRRSLT